MYSWQISVNTKKYQSLGDVYYGKRETDGSGVAPFVFPKLIWDLLIFFSLSFHPCSGDTRRVGVQIAYYAIIFSQFSMMVLSVLLAIGVYTVSTRKRLIESKQTAACDGFIRMRTFPLARRPSHDDSSFQENAGLVVPWLIGILTFISFEALGLVYANVLKDQIFGVSISLSLSYGFSTTRDESTKDFLTSQRRCQTHANKSDKRNYFGDKNFYDLNLLSPSLPRRLTTSTLMFSARPNWCSSCLEFSWT